MARRRSIVRAAAIATAFTILLPVAAVVAFESAVSDYYRGETNALTRLLKPALPYVRVFRSSESVSRRVNLAIVEDVAKLRDSEYLRSLVRPEDSLALAVRIEGEPLRVVGSVEPQFLELLPAYGSHTDPDAPPPAPESEEPWVVEQTDFRTQDDRAASVFLIRSPEPHPPRPAFYPKPTTFSRLVGFYLILALLALNGGAGLFAIFRLIKPLRKLEAAAHRLGSGDLAAPVESPEVRELEPVFRAFDGMREKLQDSIERERADERSRRELIANLSHDVRTPLTAIRGYIEGLSDGTAATPERRERYLTVLREQAGRLERMIDGIFLLSTLESGEDRPELREVELSAFLASGAEELSLVHSGRLAVSFSGGPALTVRADPFRLRRLVENLAANVVAHSGKAAATLSIELALDEGEAGARARLEFADDGRGFPPGFAERAFERFRRGDEARSGEGAGLGLSIVREIVLSMGGSVRAENGGGPDPWPGARVVISLPLASTLGSGGTAGEAVQAANEGGGA
jgi:signal transduction histidine kinase